MLWYNPLPEINAKKHKIAKLEGRLRDVWSIVNGQKIFFESTFKILSAFSVNSESSKEQDLWVKFRSGKN